MAAGGRSGTLSDYNSELVSCIEELRERREEVNRSILADEEEKATIQKDLTMLQDRLRLINEDLARLLASRNEYDSTIQESEAAYMKILESSQTLLSVLRREVVSLESRQPSSLFSGGMVGGGGGGGGGGGAR